MTHEQNDLILDAIQAVRDDVSKLDARVGVVLDDHEDRLRAAEKSIGKVRTLAGAFIALAGFFGWDVVKNHVIK